MMRIGLMMLFGAGAKYWALVFGLTFAVLLITQQSAIFMGVLDRGTGPLQNIGSADIWVSSEQLPYVDMTRGMGEEELWRLRSVPGVAWVEPMLSYPTVAEKQDGQYYTVQLTGLDHLTLVGRPPEVVEGNLTDLRLPDTVFVEVMGRKKLPVTMGEVLRINDHHARVVGFCRAKSGILSRPQFFATNENVMRMVPMGRRRVTFALVRVKSGADVGAVCRQIRAMPNLAAFTAEELRTQSWDFVMFRTSIGLNFALTVGLGMAVGLVVSTTAFSQFITAHLSHFALLKAVGVSSGKLVAMVLFQAWTAGAISYGIGVGLSGIMTLAGQARNLDLVSLFPWQLMAAGVIPMLVCVGVASVVNLLRVLRVDPVTLFQQ